MEISDIFLKGNTAYYMWGKREYFSASWSPCGDRIKFCEGTDTNLPSYQALKNAPSDKRNNVGVSQNSTS